MKQRRKLLWLCLLTLGLSVFGFSRVAISAPSQTKALLLITTSQDGETAPCG
jgi:hypothetical protein